MKAGKVFYAVLNMGLGHATRSLPIIREFLERNWEVLIGSNGRALEFLKTELPGVSFIITPDYQIKYSRSAWLLPKLIVQIPRLVSKINQEQAFCNKVVADFLPDLIISDHCYGISHKRIPSFFISHQIYFAMPNGMGSFAPLVARINFMFHKNYLRVIVPDLPDSNQGLLSGRLSRLPKNSVNYAFGGILSSITRREPKETIDLLVSISGPEPQRTLFEQKILQQIEALPGRKVVVLGKSESIQTLRNTPELMVFSHLPRREIGRLFNQAKLIVSRPGYSTLMELVELGKQALLVPTPGQTEQHALAKHAMENNWFYAVDQNKLDLVRDVEGAKDYAGLFKPNVTAWSVRNIFNNILNLR